MGRRVGNRDPRLADACAVVVSAAGEVGSSERRVAAGRGGASAIAADSNESTRYSLAIGLIWVVTGLICLQCLLYKLDG